MEKKQINENILLARRCLEDVNGYSLIEDWVYYKKINRWAIHFKLTLDTQIENKNSTNWYLTVDPIYPAGKVKICPANDNGIKHTYFHQEFNESNADGTPWKTGSPCLTEPFKVIGRDKSLQEPIGSASKKAKWHLKRLKEWIELTSKNKLVIEGEYFEVPPLPASPLSNILITAEDSKTFNQWSSYFGKAGIFYFNTLGKKNNLDIVSFFKLDKKIIKYEWGEKIPSDLGSGYLGIWILAKDTPVISNWQLPQTFGQLKFILGRQGINLMSVIESYADKLRNYSNPLLSIGFPIPEYFGESQTHIHWVGVRLPTLSSKKTKPQKGFRQNSVGWWRNDLKILRDELPLRWENNENWSVQQLSRRAILDKDINSKSFLVLGAGALGSVLVEQLAKLGVQNIIVSDGDLLKGGNLVRHTLGVDDVGENKAIAVKDRSNNSMPTAKVKGIDSYFPFQVSEKIDIVIDCTGSDELLNSIEKFQWKNNNIQFYSFSFGINLQRFFIYRLDAISDFSYQNFVNELRPWSEKEQIENPDFSLPKEGIGCWHPAFPGRYDDVSIWASIAIKELEKGIKNEAAKQLIAYKMIKDQSNEFIGIEKDTL